MTNLSIIIPTLNEECYLPVLLESLGKQSYKHFEVIVVDGHSKDKTVELGEKAIKESNLEGRVVLAKKRGVSNQRNEGVEYAKYDRLLFLDADIYLEPNFLEATIHELNRRKLDLATCEFEPLSTRLDDKLLHSFACAYVKTLQFIEPVSLGWCIYSTKNVHAKVGGFDETRHVGEDYDYVTRANKVGYALKVLKSGKVYTSVRRLEEEGRLNYYLSTVKRELYRFLKVKPDKKSLPYDFGKFGKDDMAQKFFDKKRNRYE